MKSRKLIGQLFKEGIAFSVFPIRVLFITSPDSVGSLQAGFSVSSRNFKKAKDRNRIKRLLRECYRTQKQSLLSFAQLKNIRLSVFLIYTGKEIPEYHLIKEKTAAAMESLIRRIEL